MKNTPPSAEDSIRSRPANIIPKSKVFALTRIDRAAPPILAEAIAELPEALLPIYRQLYQLLDQQTQSSMLFYFRVGQLVKECRDTPEWSKRRGRCSTQIELLADALGVKQRVLSNALRLVRAYTEQEYLTLISHQIINWAHVQILMQIEPSSWRQTLADRVVAEQLTATELERELRTTLTKVPRGPGRPPKPPRNLKQALLQSRDMTRVLHHAMQTKLFGRAYDIPTKIQNLLPDQLNESTRATVAEVIEALASLVATAAESGHRLQKSLAYIDETLAARPATEGPIATSEPTSGQTRRRRGLPIPSTPRVTHDVDD